MADTIFTAFTAMMDDLGITPPPDERDPYGHKASSALMTALEKVKDFPPESLPEIAQYAKDNDVRKASTLIREMSARLAQGKLGGGGMRPVNDDGTMNQAWRETATPAERDKFIDDYYRRMWERRYRGADRDALPPHGQLQYDELEARYG